MGRETSRAWNSPVRYNTRLVSAVALAHGKLCVIGLTVSYETPQEFYSTPFLSFITECVRLPTIWDSTSRIQFKFTEVAYWPWISNSMIPKVQQCFMLPPSPRLPRPMMAENVSQWHQERQGKLCSKRWSCTCERSEDEELGVPMACTGYQDMFQWLVQMCFGSLTLWEIYMWLVQLKLT